MTLRPALLAAALLAAAPAAADVVTKPRFSPALNAAELRLAETFAATHGGLLPQNNYWRYLERRYELDPKRFAHYHPRITPLIRRDEMLQHAPPPVVVVGVTHPTVVPPVVVPPPVVPPVVTQAVPEPGPLALAAAGGLAVLGWRKWKGVAR